MRYRQISYQSQNPIARFLAVVAGIGILALTLFLGVIFFAAFAALGLIAWAYFQIRRWWLTRGHHKSDPRQADDVVDAEYRVVDRGDEENRR